ncbi:hypothetical protein RIF29_06509 [Crotalaria pallida]|uniref:Uncharacterized protein n=1 Tax=Crotalaria pallida TaxID=3830 RepID=A0AAN9J5X7_CROPI
MKKHRKNEAYHRLTSIKEVSDCSHSSNNVTMLISPNVKMVEVMPNKIQPKIKLPTNLLKRFRDAYVEGMLCFAENVAHMNNGNICFEKKIHDHDDDDEVRYLTAS